MRSDLHLIFPRANPLELLDRNCIILSLHHTFGFLTQPK
jgi:hypothetical protein